MKKNLSLEKIKEERRKSRIDKVSSLIKKAIAETFLKLDFNDLDGKNIVFFVSNISLSGDGKSAKVYIESINDYPSDLLSKIIEENSLKIKRNFSNKVDLRYTPKLKFEIQGSQKNNF